MGSCPVQAGNIQAKMGVGTYEYGQGAGPHALTRVGARLFYYDANGNLEEERRDGNFGVVRGFRYTGADQVRRVEVPGRSAVFHYGADRARVIRKDYDGTTLKTRTDYIGNVEVVRPVGGHAEYRRYIGGVVIATWYEQTGVSQERYLHKDHLGSTVAISSSAGYVEHLLAYDPWGKRRDAHTSESWDVPPGEWLGWILAITPRGYTGHEHVDFAGIIHMNGRIYDPELGRFLQADPFVEDSTTLNRYTYVHNNPLAYVDPSGYMSVGQALRIVAAVVVAVYAPALLKPMLGQVGAVVAAGAISGYISTGNLQGALTGAFTSLIFYGIGQQFGDVMENGVIDTGKVMKKALAHGIAGGTLSTIQGGKFGHGFVSAGVSAAVSPHIDASNASDFSKGMAVAMVGGTVSAVTGGKFANGAVTAAMQFAFNQAMSRRQNEEEAVEAGVSAGRATRAKINDHTRRDHPHFRYSNLRGQAIGGVVREDGDGYRYPSDYDFQGSDGFNLANGQGARAGAHNVRQSLSGVRALIINVPEGQPVNPRDYISASLEFRDAPVYVDQGVNGETYRVQHVKVDGKVGGMSCQVRSGAGGGWSSC